MNNIGRSLLSFTTFLLNCIAMFFLILHIYSFSLVVLLVIVIICCSLLSLSVVLQYYSSLLIFAFLLV